jgi:hypothetical protein
MLHLVAGNGRRVPIGDPISNRISKRRGWTSAGLSPPNLLVIEKAVSKREPFLLSATKHVSPHFFTITQANELGVSLRKDEYS